jgi:hypothetical protein
MRKYRFLQALTHWQLDSIWSQNENFLSDAVRKDKERMDDLNKLLATVSRIRQLFLSRVPHFSLSLNQRPPLTIKERAAQVKVTVTVCYQSEEDESPTPAGDVRGMS